jgi:hypothetical protein
MNVTLNTVFSQIIIYIIKYYTPLYCTMYIIYHAMAAASVQNAIIPLFGIFFQVCHSLYNTKANIYIQASILNMENI